MSTALERRLRKMYKEGGTPHIMRSIITSNGTRKKPNLLPVPDFDSGTSSVSSSSKKNRRKIRCTEELIHLQEHLFSDSDKSPIKKSKKTKKTKAVYRLPSISLIGGDVLPHCTSGDDSDVEIVVKKKQKKKPKKKSPRKSGASESNWEEEYVERVKLILCSTNKDTNTNNSPKVSNGSVTEKLRRSSRKISSTPYPKRKSENPHFVSKDIKSESHNKTRNKSMVKRSKKSSKESCVSIENESLDLDFDSDEVFENTLQNQATVIEKTNTNSSNDLSVTIKTRKSVRIQSRDQIDASNSTKDNPVFKFKLSGCSSDNIKSPRRVSVRKSLKTPRKPTKEHKNTSTESKLVKEIEPVVFKSDKLNEKDSVLNNSVQPKRHSTLSKNSEVLIDENERSVTNTSVCESSTFTTADETVGKVQDLSVQFKNSPNILRKISIPNDSLDLINTSMPWQEEDCDENLNISNINMCQQNNSVVIPENAPKLRRTSTFTVNDETKRQTLDVPYSPLQFDTSKVNKRRRWDKSRLSTSFLDSSLSSINKDGCNKSLNKSKQSLNMKNTSKIDRLSMLKTRYNTPPSGTSTPLVERKNLLKQTLLKGKEPSEKPLLKFRTKLPNFALIHQRAFDKLENLKEMSERKAARAQLLLSGHKPPIENVSQASSKRKELKFSPTLKQNNKSLNKSNISVTKVKNVSPSTSLKVANKENRLTPAEKKKELKLKSHIPKLAKPVVVAGEKKGFTRFGFKVGPDSVKATSKHEQVKAVATKSKILKNTLEERKNAIQGVRSNRRFELLMQMRKK